MWVFFVDVFLLSLVFGVRWCDLNISRVWKIDSLLELVGVCWLVGVFHKIHKSHQPTTNQPQP